MQKINRTIDSLHGEGMCPTYAHKRARIPLKRKDGTIIRVPACTGRTTKCKDLLSSKFIQMLENREEIISDLEAIVRSKDEIIAVLMGQTEDLRDDKKRRTDAPITYNTTINNNNNILITAMPTLSSDFLLGFVREGLKTKINPLKAIRAAFEKMPEGEVKEQFKKLNAEDPKEFDKEILIQMQEAAEKGNVPDMEEIIDATENVLINIEEVD